MVQNGELRVWFSYNLHLCVDIKGELEQAATEKKFAAVAAGKPAAVSPPGAAAPAAPPRGPQAPNARGLRRQCPAVGNSSSRTRPAAVANFWQNFGKNARFRLYRRRSLQVKIYQRFALSRVTHKGELRLRDKKF